MGTSFHNVGTGDQIDFKASVQADIEISGKGRRDYESDIASAWFSIEFTGILRNGLNMVTITKIEPYSREKWKAEDALTKFLVPYMYAKDLDRHAHEFLTKYCPRALREPMPLPIPEILEAMCLESYLAPLPDSIFGRTYFSESDVEVYDTEGNVIPKHIDGGTILISPDAYFMRNVGSFNNTVVHECVHWDQHYKFFELQHLLNPGCSAISCAVIENYNGKKDDLANELDWMEWQANALAPKILMPAETTKKKLNQILNELYIVYPGTRNGELMEMAIVQLAEFFQVSTTAAKIRATELGFSQAAGVFNYVDGKYYPPVSFKKGSLKKGQTYIVDRNNAIFESFMNPALAEKVRSGQIIHAGGMFVINDDKYVQYTIGSQPELTEYALEHADECCLAFDRKTRVSTHYDDSFYRICFLSRDADSKCFVEATCDIYADNNENVQKRAEEMQKIRDESTRILQIAGNLPMSFSGTLDAHIKRRGYTNEDMEERTEISERRIRDLRNTVGVSVELPTVLALCIGLNLHPFFANDLISKAGHNISKLSQENMIYQYLINNHHMESLAMWNEKIAEAGINQHLPSNKKR